MRRSDFPNIKVPEPYHYIHMNVFPYKKTFKPTDNGKGFDFEYNIYYSKNYIIPNRECHFTYRGYYRKGSILPLMPESRWSVEIYVTAYPSAEGKNDGFSYFYYISKHGRDAIFNDDNIREVGVSLAKALQAFIDSGEEYISYQSKNTVSKGSIYVNLDRYWVEENYFRRYGRDSHELRFAK